MKFVVKPSLEHRALVKIVTSLWNQNDVRVLISEINSDNLYSNENWKMIEGRVTEKIPQLLLPELLQENVLGFIKPIGLQILEWIQFHYRNVYHRVNLPAELYWTPEGTVDRKRTAEGLVRDENLDISKRYELACIYFLEDDIIQFWNSMPENLKRCISYESQIISYWSHNMRRKGLSNAHKFYKDEFRQCTNLGNKVGAEYFLQKLTPQEREQTLVETVKDVRDSDTLYFLISEMEEEQQMEVFENKSYEVLQCFLQWPFQSFFTEIANCMWDFLSEEHYELILRNIIGKVRDGCKDWNYQKLFREFWQKSPNAQKSLILNEIHYSWLLPSLFCMKDKESIRFVIRDADLTVKDKLVYSYDFNIFCAHSIRDNEWDFLEFCIRECFPTKNLMLKFKEVFEKRMMLSYFFATKKHEWDKLFHFSDDSISRIKYV